MRSLTLILLFAIIAPLAAQDAPKPDALSKDEQAVLDLTNAQRKAANLPQLTMNPTLMKMAREHSTTMASLNQLGHDLNGTTFNTRLQKSGYPFGGAGENVAAGQQSPKEAITGWMGSPGHRANLMSRQYTEIGVAVATSSNGTRYWTQVFATPLR